MGSKNTCVNKLWRRRQSNVANLVGRRCEGSTCSEHRADYFMLDAVWQMQAGDKDNMLSLVSACKAFQTLEPVQLRWEQWAWLHSFKTFSNLSLALTACQIRARLLKLLRFYWRLFKQIKTQRVWALFVC